MPFSIMRAHVRKWGNSLAIRIPRPLADQAGITQGSLVDIRVVGESIQIDLIAPARYTLEDLLSNVNEENLHNEFDTGGAEGREIW